MARRKLAADQLDGASAAEPPRGQRRKRRSSTPLADDVDRNDRESTQQSDLVSAREGSNSNTEQPRRSRKRVRIASTTDTFQLTQEVQQIAQPSSASENITVAPDAPQHRSKRVRFSDPGPALSNVADSPSQEPSSSQPAEVTTPQGRRGSGQGKSRSNRRTSLPATLHDSNSPDRGTVQFTPLRAVLEDRKRRRLRRSGLSEEMNHIEEHKREDARAKHELQRLRQQIREKDERVNELMYELEVQRQLAIDIQQDDDEHEADKVRALEDELNTLRREIAEQKERHDLSTLDDDQIGNYDVDTGSHVSDEDNSLMLIDPEDINLTQEDMPQFNHDDEDGLSTIDEGQEEATQVSLPDPSAEVQIHQFENAIAELSKDASEARAALQILTIELQTLGFTEPDANAYDVLTSIRSAFRHARNEIEAIFPGDQSTALENGGLVYAFVERLRELKSDIAEKTKAVREQADVNTMLNSQNKGIVSKMEESEHRRQTLEGQWHELDVVSEKKTKEIVALEEELDLYKQALDERDADIIEQDKRMDEMEIELENREGSAGRLQEAIEGYRNDVMNLEALVIRMEDDHRSALDKLKEEHAAAIAELEQRLATEQLQREEAEAESDRKATIILEVERRAKDAEEDLMQLREDLEALRELKENERSQRESAEQELDDKTASIAELEQKVEVAENDLEELRSELDALRTLAENERRQREAAETELDEKDGKIAELEDKIHDTGIQANELRQKIFEVQQKKDVIIQELQETAGQREEQYNTDIAAEIARREDAEQLAAERNDELNSLHSKLNEVEQSLEGLTVEKDDLISELEERVDKLDADLSHLREEYESLAEQKAAEIQTLHDDISMLGNDVNQRAALIERMQQEAIEASEAHQAAIEQHEARIADISADLDHARADVDRLEDTRKSLESRVENEASAMLDMQNDHANEMSELKGTLADRDTLIDDLRHMVEVRDAKYTSDINAKNKEIEALQLISDSRATTIATLTAQVDSLKARFRVQVNRSQKAIAAITDNVRRAAEDVGGLEDGHTTDAQDALRDVDQMVPGEGLHGGPTRIHERVQVLKKDGRRGRRQYDSGFGVAEDEEDEAAELA